jgi:hypothetical protein
MQGVIILKRQRRQQCERQRDEKNIPFEQHQTRSDRLLNKP